MIPAVNVKQTKLGLNMRGTAVWSGVMIHYSRGATDKGKLLLKHRAAHHSTTVPHLIDEFIIMNCCAN